MRQATSPKRQPPKRTYPLMRWALASRPLTLSPTDLRCKRNLRKASDVFDEKGQDKKKRAIIKQWKPILNFCKDVKFAVGLATSGGLLALGCLRERQE